jgi:hypothetical protein
MMIQPMAVRSERIYSGKAPIRDPKYLRFIKRQASVVSGFGGCDPCHTGQHAVGQKSCDRSCIPLTRKEHDQFDADPRGFALKHGLDIPSLIQKFNQMYDLKLEQIA